MAGEVQLEHSTAGQTLYFLVRNATGSIWNGTAFEAYQTADLSTQYAISMTEQGTASRYYVGDFPAAAAGVYRVTVRIKAGGSHAETDVTAGSGTIEWDGSAVVSLYSRLAPTTAGRTLDVTAGGEAGIDWANVGSPTTTLNLSGTTIATTQKVDVETIKTQAVTCAAGVTVLASVGTAATSTAQTGDSYAIVNSGTHGNAALKTLIDTVDDFIDTEVAAIKTKTDYLPSATAGSAGGLMIAGSNAATTFASVTCTGSLTISDGLIVTRSTADASAIVATGNGAGHGISATGGISGHGMRLLGGGGSGSGDALNLTGSAGYVGLRASSLTVTGAMTVGTNALPWNSSWDTEVQSECEDALAAYGVATAAALNTVDDLLDTEIAAIKADTAAILDDTGTSGVVVASGSKAGYALSATGADLVLVDGKTLPAALQIIAAICAGKVTGAGSGTETFLGLNGSSTRAVVTVDADGNRSSVTYP